MPKQSAAAEYAAHATEVLPKPTCNMSLPPSQSISCESHPGRAEHPWLKPDVRISQPCSFKPDEFATSVNVGFWPRLPTFSKSGGRPFTGRLRREIPASTVRCLHRLPDCEFLRDSRAIFFLEGCCTRARAEPAREEQEHPRQGFALDYHTLPVDVLAASRNCPTVST